MGSDGFNMRINFFKAVILLYFIFTLFGCSGGIFGNMDYVPEEDGLNVNNWTVSISSDSNWLGGILSASASTPGYSGEIFYEWVREGANGSIGSGSQYIITEMDLKKAISVKITRIGAETSATSSAFRVSGYNPIYNEADLRAVKTNRDYILANDIEIKGQWVPIAENYNNEYSGFFEGNGKTISFGNQDFLTGDLREYYFGLFGYIGGGTVQNLKLTGFFKFNIIYPDPDISYLKTIYIGAVAGFSWGYVSNVSSEVNIKISGDVETCTVQVGGIVGLMVSYDEISIKNCTWDGNLIIDGNNTTAVKQIDKTLNVGGIVGGIAGGPSQNVCIVEYCWTAGQIEVTGILDDSTIVIGGITGNQYSDSVINNCVALQSFMKSNAGASIGRIAGEVDELDSFRSDNFASSAMLLNDFCIVNGANNNKNGKDVTLPQEEDWWKNTAGWSVNWGGTKKQPWKWSVTSKRPVLWF